MPLLFYIVQENPIAMGYVDGLPQRPCDERQYCKRKEDREVDSAQKCYESVCILRSNTEYFDQFLKCGQ